MPEGDNVFIDAAFAAEAKVALGHERAMLIESGMILFLEGGFHLGADFFKFSGVNFDSAGFCFD